MYRVFLDRLYLWADCRHRYGGYDYVWSVSMEDNMKFCTTCHNKPLTIFDYCSECGTEMVLVWKYKCLECGHGSDLTGKFCCCCGSNLFIANQEPENRDETGVIFE